MTANLRPLLVPPVCLSALEPVPVEGCDVCGALARQRKEAREASDWATLKLCNQEISEHPHAAGARPRR